jgi:signal peptidase I
VSSAAPHPGAARTGRWWAYPATVLLVVLLVLALRAFVVQSFSVPSGSMEPTIEPGDRLLVNRLVHGADLHRGDVVVFDGTTAFPAGADHADGAGPSSDYVKRVVGLPGDRVVCCDPSGRLRVNGVAVNEPYVLPGDRPSELTFDVTVPPASMWVMGDHRSQSGDSRSYLGRPGGGMVPLSDVIGQVTVRYWPPGRLGSLGGPGPLSAVPPPAGAGQ